ncbi:MULTISPECIES: hypothetical protein [Pirellulaceae]|nr:MULTISPECIES: hypothetical protein [Pirellulaceae]
MPQKQKNPMLDPVVMSLIASTIATGLAWKVSFIDQQFQKPSVQWGFAIAIPVMFFGATAVISLVRQWIRKKFG